MIKATYFTELLQIKKFATAPFWVWMNILSFIFA